MKTKILLLLAMASVLFWSCGGQNKVGASPGTTGTVNDTVRIVNDELEYEVIIIDPGFNGWFNMYAKPRNYYTQSYLEARNTIWVQEWNNRAMSPTTSRGLFEMRIDYQPGIDYGYEVNYMLFNYLTYYQLTNRIRLGGFAPRI